MNKKKYPQGTKNTFNEQVTFNTHSIHMYLLGPYSLFQLMYRKPGNMNKQTTNSGTNYVLNCPVMNTTLHRSGSNRFYSIRNDLSLLEKLSRTWLNSKLMNCNSIILKQTIKHSIVHVELLKLSFSKHAQKDQSTGKCLSHITNVDVCEFVFHHTTRTQQIWLGIKIEYFLDSHLGNFLSRTNSWVPIRFVKNQGIDETF